MGLDDGPANRQPDTHLVRLRRVERLKQPVEYGLRDPGAGIVDGDLGRPRPGWRPRPNGQDSPLVVLHGFQGVSDQAEEHLIDLLPVDDHQHGFVVEVEPDLDAPFPASDEGNRTDLLDQGLKALDRALAFSASHESAQVPNDLAGPECLIGRLVDGRSDGVAHACAVAVQDAPHALQVARDRRQRLVDLVRERRSHLADSAEPGQVVNLGLKFLQAGFQLPLTGQVADKSGEQRRAARIERADMELDREDRSVLALAEQGPTRADERILPGTLATKNEVVMCLLVGSSGSAC